MIRCIRLITTEGLSHVEQGWIDLATDERGRVTTDSLPVTAARFQTTAPGSSLDWHVAPARQLVITLRGTLAFVTRDGERFALEPGEVLLAEDTTGSGHEWSIEGDDPWDRLYVVLADGVEVPFRRADGEGVAAG